MEKLNALISLAEEYAQDHASQLAPGERIEDTALLDTEPDLLAQIRWVTTDGEWGLATVRKAYRYAVLEQHQKTTPAFRDVLISLARSAR